MAEGRDTIAFLEAQGDEFWQWLSENDVGELVGEAGVAMCV